MSQETERALQESVWKLTVQLAEANKRLAKLVEDRDQALKWQGFWKTKYQSTLTQAARAASNGGDRRAQMAAAKEEAQRTGQMARA